MGFDPLVLAVLSLWGGVAAGVVAPVLLVGSPAIWTLNGFVLPTLLVGIAPLVVAGGGVAAAVSLAKRANRRELASARTMWIRPAQGEEHRVGVGGTLASPGREPGPR